MTQAYRRDSTILGVTRDWVHALAGHCDGVDVIALDGGRETEAAGVRVFDLGKARGASRPTQLARAYRALALTLGHATAVFVHMVPRYALLAAPLARPMCRPMALWYAQGGVNLALRVASRLVDHVLTPTRDSFPLRGATVESKVRVTGHGVDTQRYAPSVGGLPQTGRMLAAGRMSAAKRYETLVEATALLKRPDWHLRIASGAGYAADDRYRRAIVAQVDRLGLRQRIELLGAVPYDAMPSEYGAAWLLAHTSATGSLDKVVLEAMACGTPVVSTAPSSRPLLAGVDGALAPTGANAVELAAALDAVLAWSPNRRREVAHALRSGVEREHSLARWAGVVAGLLLG